MIEENVITPVEEVCDAEDLEADTVSTPDLPDVAPEKSAEEQTDGETCCDGFDRLEELRMRQSIDAEYLEFARLFPGTDVSALPDSVCESVRAGVPLAAAYALYEKKKSFESFAAHEKNSKNANLSFPVSDGESEKYFSPDEVKSMSRDEVRTNYKRIIESMRHWR